MNGPKKNEGLNNAIRAACQRRMGVIDTDFLCRSLSSLCSADPLTVSIDASTASVLELLKQHRKGCVLVLDSSGKLAGIFSERDAILKVIGSGHDLASTPISTFMTGDPVTQPPDGTVAFALNLMSEGGFRNIPLVSDDGVPVGLLTVKDIIDRLVEALTEDLLEFPAE